MQHKTVGPFSSFSDFYPYYLKEHQNPTCRLLHFLGSWLVLGVIRYSVINKPMGVTMANAHNWI